jgi:hypothetical protein
LTELPSKFCDEISLLENTEEEIRENSRVLHAAIQYRTFLQLAKGLLIALGAFWKGYQIVMEQIAFEIPKLHATLIMPAIFRWET